MGQISADDLLDELVAEVLAGRPQVYTYVGAYRRLFSDAVPEVVAGVQVGRHHLYQSLRGKPGSSDVSKDASTIGREISPAWG